MKEGVRERGREGGRGERQLAQFVEILPNVSSYRAVSLVITRFRVISRKLLALSRTLARWKFFPHCSFISNKS